MTSTPFYNNDYQKKVEAILRRKPVRRLLNKIGFITIFVSVLYWVAYTQIQIVLNATPSLPQKVFVFSKERPNLESSVAPTAFGALAWLHPWSSMSELKKNRFVLFVHPNLNTRIIKQIKGVPGSILRYDQQGQLWVDDFCVGKPHATSREGKPVSAIRSGVIPNGFVFAYGSHDRSFDSRYQDFGLVPLNQILGVGVALI